MSFGRILLALLLPPAAVYLHDGRGPSLWTSLGLTLLGWVPGMAHAVYVVTFLEPLRPELPAAERYGREPDPNLPQYITK